MRDKPKMNRSKSKLYDSKNEALVEHYKPFFLDRVLLKCSTRYTIYNGSTLIDHYDVPCNEAKEHLRTLGEEDNIALTTNLQCRFNSGWRKEGALFQAKKLTPREAVSVIKEFEERFTK